MSAHFAIVEDSLPECVLPAARAWYEREMRAAEIAHGAAWPQVRNFVAECLAHELAERADEVLS